MVFVSTSPRGERVATPPKSARRYRPPDSPQAPPSPATERPKTAPDKPKKHAAPAEPRNPPTPTKPAAVPASGTAPAPAPAPGPAQSVAPAARRPPGALAALSSAAPAAALSATAESKGHRSHRSHAPAAAAPAAAPAAESKGHRSHRSHSEKTADADSHRSHRSHSHRSGQGLLLTGDIGGTNARLQLWRVGSSGSSGSASLFYRATYRPSEFRNLGPVLSRFLEDAARETKAAVPAPARAVLAVCGPCLEGGRRNESNNIPSWCPPGASIATHDAGKVEASLGWAARTLSFINDFEAIGHCIAAHLSSKAPDSARPRKGGVRTLHAPGGDVAPPSPSSPAACVGAGTGLGACLVVPQPSTHSRATFSVLCSEAGMTETLCPRDELEWRLLCFLRRSDRVGASVDGGADGGGGFLEVERVVSGPGLAATLAFLAGETDARMAETRALAGTPALSPEAAAAVAAADEDTRPAVVASYAQQGEPLCLAAVDLFLSFYGRALGTAAMTFSCDRGLFIAGGILPKLSWRVPCLGGSPGPDPLLEGYLQQGPKMSGFVGRIPLRLLDDNDAGLKGCLNVALSSL